MTFFISHTGCDSAEYDAEKIRLQLMSFGILPSTRETADIIILLGCTFTQQKEIEFKSNIQETVLNVRPKLFIVSGCYLSWTNLYTNVIFARKEEISHIVREYLLINNGEILKKRTIVDSHSPIVAISEGCYGHCTFCSVKNVRGVHRSREIADIISDIKLSLSAHNTIRFVGQDVAAYGRDKGTTLWHLLRKTFKEFPEIKFELGSLNPKWLIKSEINDLLLLNNPNIVGNIHVPLQSASEHVLKRMNRGYTYEEFILLWIKLRDNIGIDNLSTDLISGFPGETESDHFQTIEFLNTNKLSFAQIFMYDPRPGTAAATYNQLPRDLRLKRTLDLIAEYIASYLRFYSIADALGSELSVPFNSNIKLDLENISDESETVFSQCT